MSGENNDNPGLLTLDQLKSDPAHGVDATEQPEAATAPEQGASVQEKRSRSFIDDAESLLADIRNSVEDEVTSERARYDAQRLEVESERDKAAAENDRAARAEIEAQLAVERARRQAAADDRLAREREIDLEERRARGEVIAEEVEEPVPAQISAPVIEPAAPPEEQRRGTGFYLAIVGLPVLAIVGIGAFLLLSPPEAINQPGVGTTSPTITVVTPPVTTPVAAIVTADAATPKQEATTADGGPGDAGVGETATEKRKTGLRKKKKRKRRASSSRKRKRSKSKRSKAKKKKKKSKKNTLSFDEDDGF
jgi:hypothetical protein